MRDDKKNRIQDMLAFASGISDLSEQSRKYKTIVGILSQEAMRSAEPWYLEEAIRAAGLVTEDPSKAYVEIIRAMAKIGVNKRDEKKLNEAIKITERIDNDLDLSVALHELVIAFAKTGIEKKDERIFSYSNELIQKIPMNTYRSSAFRNIARMLAAANPKKALELLEIAIELIEKCKDTESIYLVSAFCDISALLALLNDTRSYGFIRRAMTLASGIVDEFEKSAVLLKIVETESVIGVKQNDDSLLKEAIAASEGITKEYYKTLVLNAIKRFD